MKKIILLSVAIMLAQLAFSQSFYPKLQILNPKAQWQADIASITEAQIFVRPKGVYMEYNIYMTYAATNTYLNKTTDTTEIVHFFNLPSKAIVTDSWLWVNDVIVKADLIDKWAATQIYEGIVKRNQDPSILTKTGPIDYQFRIFPLPGGKTRKVKITVLVPIDFSNDKVSATLPLNLFSLSKVQLKKFMLVFPEMNGWESPALSEKSNLVYKTETDPVFGKYTSTEVPYSKENAMTVTFKNPMTDGVYVANYKAGKENFYAMALQPSKIYTAPSSTKKITFAIAHDDDNSSTKWSSAVNVLKQNILKSLNEKDSFNIIYNDLIAVKYSNQWINASAENVDAIIKSLQPKVPFGDNLAAILSESLSWNKANQGDAIVLLAATDSYSTITKANALIKVLETQYPSMPAIHIADYGNIYPPYTLSNGKYYFGNEYLYTYLTQKTGGNFSSWRETNGLYNYAMTKSLSMSMEEIMSGLFNVVKNLDIYTTLEDGYCHSRYNINIINSNFYNNTIVQSGKYEGNFPLNIQIAGTVGEVGFFKKYSIPETKIVAVDSTIKQIWTGAYLADNEFKAISNATIKDLLAISKKNRVLSQYTAFLALEPGMNEVQPCSTCTDETTIITTATEESEKDSLTIKVFPNPFRDKVTIEISATNTSETEIKVAIFNLTGQIVHQTTLPIDDNKATLNWDADTVQNGMYIAQIQIGAKKYNVKLLKME